MVSAQATTEPAPEPRPGPDGNAVRLGPLDEVGDDQEVAGKLHLRDDVDLEGEALVVVLAREARRQRRVGEAPLEAGLGLRLRSSAVSSLSDLLRRGARAGGDEARQDRLAALRAEGAALGDLDRVGQRLGQVGEQRRHLLGGLEVMLARQPAPVVLDDVAALGDAQQRVVRLVVVGRGEVDLVGGDDRQAARVGEIEQRRLGVVLVLQAVPLDLDVQPVAEDLLQLLETLERCFLLALAQRQIDRAVGSAGQRDQALAVRFEALDLDMRRLVLGRIEEGAGGELHQVLVAALVGAPAAPPHRPAASAAGWRRRVAGPLPCAAVAEIDLQGAADDRLDAGAGQLVGELQRAEQVVGVGQAEGREAVADGELGQPRNGQRAFQQRIGGVHLEVHEGQPGGGAAVGRFGGANHLVHGCSAAPIGAGCNSASRSCAADVQIAWGSHCRLHGQRAILRAYWLRSQRGAAFKKT